MPHDMKGETPAARAVREEITGRGPAAAFGLLPTEADLAAGFHEPQ